MDTQALASTPLFLCSLVICAILTAYAFALGLRSIFSRLSRAAASAGLSPYELEAVEAAGVFHNQLEALIEDMVSLEELSREMPGPFSDHSWVRLVKLCEDLEASRSTLHELLQEKDFPLAFRLGSFLTGAAPEVPTIPEGASSIELRSLAYWHSTSRELLQRMISKIEDSLSFGLAGTKEEASPEFLDTLKKIKETL
jgi:hypothetical protein